MSTTSIYRLGREPAEIGQTRNSWRGAMYIWGDIGKRYFGLETFPMFDQAAQRKVWNAHRHAKLPPHEVIVLMTTMDGAVIYGRDAKAVADALERYGEEHPNSSLAEQAEILRRAELQPDDLIAWRQTSVSEFWGLQWDEAGEQAVWYDPIANNKHFDAYAAALAP